MQFNSYKQQGYGGGVGADFVGWLPPFIELVGSVHLLLKL